MRYQYVMTVVQINLDSTTVGVSTVHILYVCSSIATGTELHVCIMQVVDKLKSARESQIR